MQRFSIAMLCSAIVFIASIVPAPARADASPDAQAVLAQEGRWLTAIVAGDRRTVDAILSHDPEFTHITAGGKLLYRAQELAATKKEAFTMKATGQTVDFISNVAIVHGINTIMQPHHPTERVRFTDVFVRRGATWQAVSAQESAIVGNP
ncbi:MAG: nuclear transport factor 2 family protein [Candidatus Tumulicola sp.]